MNRGERKRLAEETLAIIEQGGYSTADGQSVDIGEVVRACNAATRYVTPEMIRKHRREVQAQPAQTHDTRVEVVNESTLAGIEQLAGEGPVAVLNFASARHPGGGFLKGADAQEESLARSSALYTSLCQATRFYDHHRTLASALYTDAMILSPRCPVFRDEDGALLAAPRYADFITCAAPNAREAADKHRRELSRLPDVLRRRADALLALAAAEGYRRLLLGAWGCGAFGNDPQTVACVFANHLLRGEWAGRFERVRFSVLDASRSHATLKAFQAQLAGG